MKNEPFKKFGFVLKTKEEKATEVATKAAKWCTENGAKVVICDAAVELIKEFPDYETQSIEDIPKNCDAIVVFGGDGTFLSVARQIRDCVTPIIGINLGHLGFLTEVPIFEADSTFKDLVEGNYEIQERSLLNATTKRFAKELQDIPIINDAVITNSDIARIIDLGLKIDGVDVATIRADGLIISTPTGSTAYSLAAGGPILHPSVSATIITAISPHSLTFRPIVVPGNAKIEVTCLKRDGSAMLTLDGQVGYDLEPGDVVQIEPHTKNNLRVIHTKNFDYFTLLKTKLKLGARGEENEQC